MSKTVLRSKGQLTIPAEVREATRLEEGDPVVFEVVDGCIVMRPLKTIDADQAWFWTEGWQKSVRRSLAEVEAGEGKTFDNDEDFLASLDE